MRIGDPVFIVSGHGKPYRQCAILDIKKYKKNIKIFAWNDEWDAASGNPWIERNRTNYFGPKLVRFSEEIKLEYDEIFMHVDVERCLCMWESLSLEQKKRFGKIASDILAEKFERI